MAVIRFAEFELDTASCELRKRGVLANLQRQPANVLALLASHPGQMLTREEIRKAIWGEDTFVDFDQGLNYCIRQIRTVLRDDSERPRFVETLPRRGYRFIAPVITLTNDSALGGLPPGSFDSRTDTGDEKGTGKGYSRRVVWACASAALFASALIAWFFMRPRPVRSIAVLQLANLSTDPNQKFFADGVTDELITNLAQISSLRVISHTSSSTYLGTHKSAPEIARELGVDALVEGSVARSGNKVRITTQLIQAASDNHLWAHTYDLELSDILTVQGEVARDIAESISSHLTQQERDQLSRPRPVKPEVALLLFQGSYYLDKLESERARDIFAEATRLDPNSAESWAGLADAFHTLGVFGHFEAFPEAKDAASKALLIDASQARALMVLGMVSFLYEWNPTDSEAYFRRSIKERPSYAMAHALFATVLAHRGKSAEALEQFELTRRLESASVNTNSMAWHVYFCAGKYEEALRSIRATIEVDPSFAPAYGRLVISLEQQGKYYDAIEAVHHRALVNGVSPDQAERGAAQFRKVLESQGPLGYWQHKLEFLLAERSPGDVSSSFQVARCYMHLGKREEALKELEAGYKGRDMYLIFWLPIYQEFSPLRSDARFQAMLHGFGIS